MSEGLKIMVIMGQSLFGAGLIQRLLEETNSELRVIDKSAADLTARLEEFQPEVVILDENDAPLRGRVMADSPKSVVVTLGFDQKGAVVYRPRQLYVSTVRDLVDYLRRSRQRPSRIRGASPRRADRERDGHQST